MISRRKMHCRLASILGLALVYAAAPASVAADEAPSCPGDARWGLVIDAGSSGSRLKLYCWRPGTPDALPWIDFRGDRRQEPGIADADCRRTPDEAAATLAPLLDFARATVGEERSARTPLALLATAGLRQCPEDHQDAVLARIREVLADTSFASPRARLLSGGDEGRYGWAAVNYLLRRLDAEEPRSTVGALDLGGVSTQITFSPPSCPRDLAACRELEVGGGTFPLYTHSYLGWGQDEAMRRVASRACYLRGDRPAGSDLVGRGRYRACRRAIRRGIARELRRDPPRPACTRSCTRLGAYQPPVTGDFVAFSAFAYNTGFLGLGPELTPAQLAAAGKRYCRQSWRDVAARCEASPRPGCREEWLDRYCFASAYLVTLLHDVYGFPMDRVITSTNELAGTDIDWALGAMLELAGEIGGGLREEPGSTTAGGGASSSAPCASRRAWSSPARPSPPAGRCPWGP